MAYYLLNFFITASLMLAPGLSLAQQSTHFSSIIEDLPLMHTMQELPDTALVFDKAEGRVAEFYASTPQKEAQQIYAFYSQTLPALGWQQHNKHHYQRNGEQLMIDLVENADQDHLLVHFRLTP